jgi:hypothetical protein
LLLFLMWNICIRSLRSRNIYPLAKLGKCNSNLASTIYLFTIYKVHPNPILFDIIKFYSTESVFKIIWIVCIELWEVYINFIWSRFEIAFSINERNPLAKSFMTVKPCLDAVLVILDFSILGVSPLTSS